MMETLCSLEDAVRPALPQLWRNLLVMKSGKSVLGAHTFGSEGEAKSAAMAGESWFTEKLKTYSDVLVKSSSSGELLYCASEYAYSMQMPQAAA